MNQRRRLAYTVILCLTGAGLALFAATRTWAVEVVARPAPLPPIRTPRTGGDLLPWLSPLAMVGLAGSGVVVATRGWARRWIGVLLLVAGLGIAAGGAYGLSETTSWWALACLAGGLALAAGGARTALRGPSWPSLGTRYERAARQPTDGPTAAWDALDRGEDPTLS